MYKFQFLSALLPFFKSKKASFIYVFAFINMIVAHAQTDQFIVFDSISTKNCSVSSFILNATATSGLPVSFTVVSGPASVSGNNIFLDSLDFSQKQSITVLIKASQGGNSQFNPANDEFQSFDIKSNSLEKLPDQSILKTSKLVFCEGESFNMEANTLAGVDYKWITPLEIIYSSKTGYPVAVASISGTYNLQITESRCRLINTSFLVTITSKPVINLLTPGAINTCENATLTLAAENLSGVNYTWINSQKKSLSGSNVVQENISLSDKGFYTLLASTQSCTFRIDSVDVNIKPLPQSPEFLNFKDTLTNSEMPYQLQVSTLGGQLFVNDILQSDNLILNFTSTGTYTLKYIYTSDLGCKSVIARELYYNEVIDPNYKVYSVITPNNDSKNDFFYVENIEKTTENQVIIYDGWGNSVFRSRNYDNTWSPKDLNKGEYFYWIKIKEESKVLTGSILILK